MVFGVQQMSKPLRVLFICAGNICRSPALKGILESIFKQRNVPAYIESCGLHSFFLGSFPDKKMQSVAKAHGLFLDNQAKLFEDTYFDQFDWIFCATQEILESIQHMAHQKEFLSKLYLATHFSKTHEGQDIPDPYFEGDQGFNSVWEMMEEACQGIADALPFS